MFADIKPSQMHATLVAMAEGPGVRGKPRVIQRRQTALLATEGRAESDDLEANSLRIGKAEFILPIIQEAISIVSDSVQTPCAQPITTCHAQRRVRVRFKRRFGNSRNRYFGLGHGWPLHMYEISAQIIFWVGQL